jgi:hypothetical protein
MKSGHTLFAAEIEPTIEGSHHPQAVVVEEDYPAALRDVHNAAAAFGTEKADANDCWSPTPRGAPPLHSMFSSYGPEVAGSCR